MYRGKLGTLGGLAAAAALAAGGSVMAAPMLRDILPHGDNRAAPPPVARYLGVEGQSFIFEKAPGGESLLKFDGDPEVWVLKPSPAPRGDVIYRNDAGEPVLRINRLGGLTLFTEEEPEGLPVDMMSEAEDLSLPPGMPQGALLARLAQASLRAGRAAQHPITFYASNVPPQAAALFADAAAVAADAVVRMSRRADARAFLARLDRLTFMTGPKADVAVMGSMMQITIVPAKGFAGRPSSDKMLKAATKR